MIKKLIFRPIALGIAQIINAYPKIMDTYRSTNFKGKLLISEFVNKPNVNQIYDCNGIKYYINFSDKIQEMVYL